MKNLSVKRLNADASLYLEIDGIKVIIDPWLISSEVDGSHLFNEAWHVNETVSIDDVNRMGADFCCISLPFADHCHDETLSRLNEGIPIVCNREIAQNLKSRGLDKNRSVLEVPLFPDFIEVGSGRNKLAVSFLAPSGALDFTHGGLVLRGKNMEHILIAPHGIKLDKKHSHYAALIELRWMLLCITFSTYALPLVLGGTVNLGEEKALALVEALVPKFVMDIHSEQKVARGLVPLVAKPEYPTTESLSRKLGSQFLSMQGLGKKVLQL